jgi:hyaluronoglucosaminidase
MKISFTSILIAVLGLNYGFAQTKSSHQVVNVGSVPPVTSPMIFPTPVSLELGKGSITLGNTVTLTVSPGTRPEIVRLVRKTLELAGVDDVFIVRQVPNTSNNVHIVLDGKNSNSTKSILSRSGAVVEENSEGYTIAILKTGKGAIITLAGKDENGLFHAAQTFRQLALRPSIPVLVIKDHPLMAIRGIIEGFYGAPWSMADRKKHLNFLSTLKANTYVYSPKDDPYARDRWREAYPADTLRELSALVETARQNHINFVYAISPGPSICFSDPVELKALERKFEAMRSIGIHNFYLALDDIEYTKWNCDKDKVAFGPSGAAAAGLAQSKLLNFLQASLNTQDPSANPLIMVPTEYYDAKESPYKEALRKDLDKRIVIQWTGTDVVPPAISIGDARSATKAFGRKTLLWDNYPVNDYEQTAGRLLLAPYIKREAGLSAELIGILSNPMNQEVPSRVAVTGVLAFGWNDKSYDSDHTWHYAARELAGGDERTTKALLTFFDTQHMAPTFGSQPWQEQAPKLKAIIDEVREYIAMGNDSERNSAIAKLIHFSNEFAIVPDIIRSGIIDTSFTTQARPWLEAMQLWGRSLQLTALGLDAANRGNIAAIRYFTTAKQLAAEAGKIQTIPGATRFGGSIKIADGVLDNFVKDAPKLIGTHAPEFIKNQ